MDESLSPCLSCYYQGSAQASSLPPLSLLKLADHYIKVDNNSSGIISYIAHSFRSLNPRSDLHSALYRLSLTAVDCAELFHLHQNVSRNSMFALPLYCVPLLCYIFYTCRMTADLPQQNTCSNVSDVNLCTC